MLKSIKWPLSDHFFQGRNGCYPCVGIEVLTIGAGAKGLHLSPICRRGVANGFIEIPSDQIDGLIDALREAKAEIEGAPSWTSVETSV